MTTPSVAVVGAGVTGLTAAYTLQQEARRRDRPLSLVVLDAAAAPGGHARTIRRDGFTIECGPNGFLTREPHTLALVEALGLTNRLVEARAEARRRYLLRGGRLCAVPDGPRALVTSPALSWRAKLRLLAEPFAAAPGDGEETVHAFATRRLGAEVADTLVDAAVAGISAGDSRHLSIAAQFPTLVEMERAHGSLLRAMFAPRPPGQPRARLVSFDHGLGVLTGALADALGDAVRCGAGVARLERRARRWTLVLSDGGAVDADAVVLATPARAAAAVVRDMDATLADTLASIEYAGMAVAALGYRTADVPRPLDGYGYLTSRREGLATLGVVWESSLFPHRAAASHVLLRAMLGGTRRPEVAGWTADAVLDVARRELAGVLGISAAPVHASVQHWPAAIAQYTLGHRDRRARILAQAARHPGLVPCGTAYDGVSFNDAVKSGRRAALEFADSLWVPRSDAAARPVLEVQV